MNPPKPPNPPNCEPAHTKGAGWVVPNPIVKTRTWRSAACRAAVSGSTPCVFAPSVSTTIASSAYPPPLCLVRAPVGATEGSACAMASSEVRMPWPIAVPREVLRPATACSSVCVSCVGGTSRPAVPANATRPMRGPPAWEVMKSLVAFSAAVIRFGFTSVEHMEPEMSRASRIVADDEGTGTVTCGRAAPTPSTANPAASSAAGMRLLQRVRPGTAARTSAIEVTRTAARLRRRSIHHQIPNTSGITSRASRAHGQENDISDHPTRSEDGEHGACGEQRESQGDKCAGEGDPPVCDGEPEVARRCDAVELAGVRGGVIRAAGGMRDRLEGVLVERGVQAIAVNVDGGPRGGADTDGVDMDARLFGDRGGPGRADSLALVLPVGEHHDRGRGPVADVRRGAAAPDCDRLARDRGQRGDDGRAQRGATRDRQAVDRRLRDGVVGARPRGRERALLEGDDADIHAVRLGLDERPGRPLRGCQPGGGDVSGTHAARDVHGEDDGAGGAGHGDGCGGARRGDREYRDAGDGEPHTGLPGAARRRDSGRGQGGGPAPREGGGSPGEDCGDEQPKDEQGGGGEAHARLRWVRATTSTSEAARSSAVLMRWMGTPARRMPAVS